MNTIDSRLEKAHHIVAAGVIRQLSDSTRYAITSLSDPFTEYTVDLRHGSGACTCPDFVNRQATCKHILAVHLYKEVLHQVETFRTARGWTLAKLADALARLNPTEAEAPKIAAFQGVVKSLLDADAAVQELRDKAKHETQIRQATVFQLKYWWPGTDAERALDPLATETDDNQVEDLLIMAANERHWRKPKQTLADIRDYIQENGLRVASPDILTNRRKGRWQGQYKVAVYREIEAKQ